MEEHFECNEGSQDHDKALVSSVSSGELTRIHVPESGTGSKSPSKTRKQKKVSLFKKSASQEEGFTRSSGKGKRRSAKDKKLDHREQFEDILLAEVPLSTPSAQQSGEVGYHHQYDITVQEVEHKSTSEVSVKRVQKMNKDLVKHNNQLVKTVDSLKKEKELLVSERVKLKTENKSLEKDLKKASSKDRMAKKSSQSLIEESSCDVDVLREKVQHLEDQLTERDHTVSLLKLRLDKSQVEVCGRNEPYAEDMEKLYSIVTKNGGALDSTTALEMLLEEHDTSLQLRRENEEMKSRLTTMEVELESFRGHARDLITSSPRSPRKRASGFFKRGKKNNSSGNKHEDVQIVRAEFVHSGSPVLTDSREQLEMSVSPLHSQKESCVSLPAYSSPNLSPLMPTKNKAHAEILTLQSCLKLAIDEKNMCFEHMALLEKQLDGTKSKIAELEDSISASAEKVSEEVEQLQSSLKMVKIERDTFCGELKIVQQEIDELVDKNDEMDGMYTESLSEKNKRIQELVDKNDEMDGMYTESFSEKNKWIQELELQVEALKKAAPATTTKIASPPYNKPPLDNSSALRKQNNVLPSKEKEKEKEKVVSPQHQPKEVKPASSKESNVVKVSQETKSEKTLPPVESRERPRERLPSVNSPRHKKQRKLSREKSQDKLAKVVPPSPTRRSVGRLSRESSIDRFENPQPKELKRASTVMAIPSASLVHSPKVAATRAMFEQKIDETKTDQSNVRRISRSSMVVEQKRRSSVSTANPGTGTKDTAVQQPQHSKSYSCDFAPKQSPSHKVVLEQSTGSSGIKSKAVAPAPAMEQINEPRPSSNEAKNKINSTQHQQQQDRGQTGLVAAARRSKASENVTKVSRITITSVASPTSSPTLSSRKDMDVSSPRGEQPAVLMCHPTSPSLSIGTANRKTPSPTPSRGQIGQTNQIGPTNATKVSTVSTTVKHSTLIKAPTITEIPPSPKSVHSSVARSQTESRLQAPSIRTRSGIWSSTSNSTTAASNRVVVKVPSRLGNNLLSPANKSGSLQNIPAQFSTSSSSSSSSNETKVSTTQNKGSSTVSTPNQSSVDHRGPTHKAMQRRERKDRPKTMYAGRAETANLVNLISRFQEAEKENKVRENGVVESLKSPASGKINGMPMSSTSPAKSSSISSQSSVPAAVQSTKEKLARPASYCHTNNQSNSENSTGLHFQSPPSYSSKPLPHERIMQRSRTVAEGMGTAKLSKKAMLLKWCQFITQDYENVNICNFAESFSSGLAFCAMMHHFLPDQIPFNTLNTASRENNFKLAFQAAEGVGIPSLLDVEDMVSLPKPDWMSVMTYVSFIYNKFGQQNQQQKQSSMV